MEVRNIPSTANKIIGSVRMTVLPVLIVLSALNLLVPENESDITISITNISMDCMFVIERNWDKYDNRTIIWIKN